MTTSDPFQFLRRVAIDIEGNGLYDTVTLIHCIRCIDIDTNEMFKFSAKTPFGGHHDFRDDFIDFARGCGVYIGHNILGYDCPVINKLIGEGTIEPGRCVDTLVLSRLFRPTPAFRNCKGDNRFGGHSLEAWGVRLGYNKIHFKNFDFYTEEMGEYCDRDTELLVKVYHALIKEKEGFSQECIDLEHMVAQLLFQQEQNGFYLDQVKAHALADTTARVIDDMLNKLQILFPPVFKLQKNYMPRMNKDGTLGIVSKRILDNYEKNPNLKREVKEDGSYDLFEKITFNPGSSDQKAERLLGLGWKPKKFTEKGNIKTDQETLEEAIAELITEHPDKAELKCLSDYTIVVNRHQKALKWLELAQKDGRVHGRINPIGASTHRCSHFDDNMANIASVVTKKNPIGLYNVNILSTLNRFDPINDDEIYLKHDDKVVEVALRGMKGAYGWDSRDCWSASKPDNVIVGADAAGIQLRALAHYMNDPEYTKQLLEGDIHEVNRVAAGIATRPVAKTFIYAWVLGAGDEKVGTIVTVKDEEWDSLFSFASRKRKHGKDYLTYVVDDLRDKGRRADKKTVATIIKGYKTKDNFLNRTPALKRFRMEEVPESARRGYVVGLDGRKIWVPNEHLTMGAYLQGFEAVVMKKAKVLYHDKLRQQKVPFWQVAFVHDEYQVETPVQYADVVGSTIVKAIREAGVLFKTNCPLDGEYKVGRSWAQTH